MERATIPFGEQLHRYVLQNFPHRTVSFAHMSLMFVVLSVLLVMQGALSCYDQLYQNTIPKKNQ